MDCRLQAFMLTLLSARSTSALHMLQHRLLPTHPWLTRHSGARILALAASPSIEVERKFLAEDIGDLQARVLAQGGVLLGEQRFTDEYFDTNNCLLTRQDIWLRRRDTSWELKLPVDDDARRSGGERTVFRELEGEDAVLCELKQLLVPTATQDTLDTTVGELENLLQASGVQRFAEFSTRRARFKLGRCTVDADVASFGHGVVEIEVMCRTEDEVNDAEAEIERAAAALEVNALGGSGGKLETYIRRFCPNVLSHLIDAGVLKPLGEKGM